MVPKLLYSKDPLRQIGMDILGPLWKTIQGNQFLVFMKDLQNMLTKSIPTTKTNTATVACIFLEHRVANHRKPSKLDTGDGPQLESKFFVAVRTTVVVNGITITGYHPQTSSQAERFSSTLESGLLHYMSQHHSDWDTDLLPSTYAYDAQVERIMEVSGFSLELMGTPPTFPTVGKINVNLASDDNMALQVYAGLEINRGVTSLRQEADKNLILFVSLLSFALAGTLS